MAKGTYISLDSTGFTTVPSTVVRRVFAGYLGSNYSQSNVHYSQVSSLAKDIQSEGNNPVEIARRVERSLIGLFVKYLDRVEVTVTAEELDKDLIGTGSGSRYNLLIDMTFVEGDRTVTLGEAIRVQDKSFSRIAKVE